LVKHFFAKIVDIDEMQPMFVANCGMHRVNSANYGEGAVSEH
jgi:hypothetical protein